MGAVMDQWLIPLIVSCVVTAAGLRLLLSRLKQFALDTPNHRSLHEVPVPRTGGWALLAGVGTGIGAGILVSKAPFQLDIFIAFLILLAVSLVDDLRPLSARLRFPVQVLSVSVLLSSLGVGFEYWFIWPLLIVAGVWVVNLYNFMDGMDGFAGSMTCIGFGTLGLVCVINGAVELAGFCFLMAISSVVFLYYNWPQARIFLGDAGSTVIGLAAFTVTIAGWQQGAFSLLVPLLIFLPFWLDATMTLILRVWRGERWWEAHRQHLYQRMALKFGVKKSLYFELTVMACTSLGALFLVIFRLI